MRRKNEKARNWNLPEAVADCPPPGQPHNLLHLAELFSLENHGENNVNFY